MPQSTTALTVGDIVIRQHNGNSFTVTREDRREAQGNTTVSAAAPAPKAGPRLRKRRFSLPNW